MFFLSPEVCIIFNSRVDVLYIIFTLAGDIIIFCAAIVFSTDYGMIPILVGVLLIFMMKMILYFSREMLIIVIFVLGTYILFCYVCV